ncbi:hypothetical protein B0H19DRAFT_1143725 [Mycena capillaripes]|nr:hypothetical protein B0H19DRAFT_1143725 [Mycena capillaripes]
MVDHGAPPEIPQELQPYNSYVEDPKWQRRFTLMWGALLGVCVLLAAPRVVRGLRTGAVFAGFMGVRVAGLYAPLPSEVSEKEEFDDSSTRSTLVVADAAEIGTERRLGGRKHWIYTAVRLLSSFALWHIPGIDLNIGQMSVVAIYLALTIFSIIFKAPLNSNPNRPGFLALAQLPPVFLAAMKNSPAALLLLGPGADYTRLNYVHRWAGRGLFLGAVVHGALWIQNHLTYGIPILGRQKETSGVAALACLCVLVLASIGPLRRWCYSLFLLMHFLTFPAFFITLCYHTPFASPWIIPPSPATGWVGGQHVQVRLTAHAAFAHPLSIACAPPDTTCLSPPPGLLLAARARGPWSRALWAFGSGAEEGEGDDGDDDDADSDFTLDLELGEGHDGTGRPMHAVLDGQYGGPTRDAGAYGAVLFLAGGSGVTATLGQLDELVGRCVRRGRAKGERTTRVEWVWCVRDADALSWFAPQLAQIAAVAARAGGGLVLRIRVFITRAAGGVDPAPLAGCEVCIGRPTVAALLDKLVDTDGYLLGTKDAEHGAAHVPAAGGVAVFAAGPRGLVREAGNAVARANLLKRAGVDFCAEAFVI